MITRITVTDQDELDAAIAKYRDDFQSYQPAEVTTERNVYFSAEDDWIESLNIEDET